MKPTDAATAEAIRRIIFFIATAFYRLSLGLTSENSSMYRRRMRHKALIAFLSIWTVFALQAQNAKKSVWDGTYTAAQAERGQKAYSANCAGCHQSDLGGKGEVPALRGDNFMERWHDYSVK